MKTSLGCLSSEGGPYIHLSALVSSHDAQLDLLLTSSPWETAEHSTLCMLADLRFIARLLAGRRHTGGIRFLKCAMTLPTLPNNPVELSAVKFLPTGMMVIQPKLHSTNILFKDNDHWPHSSKRLTWKEPRSQPERWAARNKNRSAISDVIQSNDSGLPALGKRWAIGCGYAVVRKEVRTGCESPPLVQHWNSKLFLCFSIFIIIYIEWILWPIAIVKNNITGTCRVIQKNLKLQVLISILE